MERDFVAQAACGGADPRIFNTGDRSPSRAARKREKAMAFCNSCPVRLTCLADQLQFEAGTSDEPYGIVGGELPGQRKILLLQQRQEALPVAA